MARAMTMDAAVDPLPESEPQTRASSVRAPGRESLWVLSAMAAAPWPLTCLVLAIGVPGPHAARTPWSFWVDGPPPSRLLHGPLAFALALGAMALWVHRPGPRAARRWMASVLGMGALGELVANALTDQGRREGGLVDLPTAAHALLVWLTFVVIFELAPVLGAASGLTRQERRIGGAAVALHAAFLGLAALATQLAPSASPTGTLWFVSPWLAAALVLPFAAARSGPARTTRLPDASGRAGPLFGLAALAWLLAAGFVAADHEALSGVPRALRFGADPRASVLLAAPLVATVCALAAAASLVWAGTRARRAPSGEVLDAADGGFTLDARGGPAWVALEAGPLPPVGAEVTLVGPRPAPSPTGPFRDGAGQWRARRVWSGPPSSLAGALHRRAAGWLAWAGGSAAGTFVVARALFGG